MLSKELLTNVLQLDTICTEMHMIDKHTIWFEWKGDSKLWFTKRSRISIYQLANICKKWALTKDYMIVSFMNWNKGDNCTARVKLKNDSSLFGKYDAISNTEPEAIFKACEWILENEVINE